MFVDQIQAGLAKQSYRSIIHAFLRMPRVTTAFSAALALIMPLGRPLLVGLTPVVGIGAGLLSTQTAYAQNATDLLNSGLDKAKSGNLKGAIADWTKAIEIYPKYALAYYNRGLARDKLGDFKGAIADYTKAIEINPDYVRAYNNRGNSKHSLKDYQGAISDYTKAIKIDPSDADYYYNRGNSKRELGDLKGACTDWRKAAELGDTDAAKLVRDQC